jgi:lysophospholipase L1-like esterase
MLAGLSAALALAAASAGDLAAYQDCHLHLCGVSALGPVFETLNSRDMDRFTRVVHILQIGDSHTAGDAITGAWRDMMQARYGVAGRGVMPPGRPYVGYIPHGVQVTQSGEWSVDNTLSARGRIANGSPIFGLSGFRVTARTAGAAMTLSADPKNAFDHLVVCAEASPAGTGVSVTLGASSFHISLADAQTRVVCTRFDSPEPQLSASLSADSAGVTLTSWASFGDGPGVILSNLGVIGAQLRQFASTSDAAVAEELDAYRPDLVVLAFGTNEGFSPHFDAAGYELLLRQQIQRVRKLSHDAPILLIGAPDAQTRRRDLQRNDAGQAVEMSSGVGPTIEGLLLDAAPMPDAPPQTSTRRAGELDWYSPPALAVIRKVQLKVAQALHVGFWDWGGRLGGAGQADKLTHAVPPLMRPDHVHFTTAGGGLVAQTLQTDLDAVSPPQPVN